MNCDEQPAPSGHPASRPAPGPQRIQLFLGMMLMIVILALIFVLFRVTQGHFLAAHWVAFYASIALLTGTVFWMLTGATGTYVNRRLGIRLGGGAAIGVFFMVLAYRLTPHTAHSRYQVIPVSGTTAPILLTWNEALRQVWSLPGASSRFLVEFEESAAEGYFDVSFWAAQHDSDTYRKITRRYQARRGREPMFNERLGD